MDYIRFMNYCQDNNANEYTKIEVGEVFKDKNRSGGDKRWRERKLNNIRLGMDFTTLNHKNVSDRVYSCAERLEFGVQRDGTLKLSRVWFCKNKLCPVCNWRRSLKHSTQASKVIDKAIKENRTAQFLFLTLTVKNVSGTDLNKALSDLTKSFDRLIRRAKVKKNLIGFMRATEVTYNQSRDDYHPHLHILLMVKSTYFKGVKNYISQEEWCAMWQQSAKLSYTPQVDIRKVKSSNNNKKDIKKAVLETAKYPVKPIDSLKLDDHVRVDVVNNLYNGLYKKRQIAYGGELKRIFQEMKLDDLENGNLVNVDEDSDSEMTVNKVVAEWFWDTKNYYRTR